MKAKSLIAACAVLAATLGTAVAPADARPMMMRHHHRVMMHHRHHMMHPRMTMRHHTMHRHPMVMHRAM